LLEDARASGAERRPDRQLLSPAQRARKEQVPDVRAGDQQHQRNRGEEHHQRPPNVADDQLLKRDHGCAPARVGLREFAFEPRETRPFQTAPAIRRCLRFRAITASL
jgi:hypothetical protein